MQDSLEVVSFVFLKFLSYFIKSLELICHSFAAPVYATIAMGALNLVQTMICVYLVCLYRTSPTSPIWQFGLHSLPLVVSRLTIQNLDAEFCTLVDLLECFSRRYFLLPRSHSAKPSRVNQRAHQLKYHLLLQSFSSSALQFHTPQDLVKLKR